jgi:hypothetical protein
MPAPGEQPGDDALPDQGIGQADEQARVVIDAETRKIAVYRYDPIRTESANRERDRDRVATGAALRSRR